MENKNYKKKCSGKDSNHALGSAAWLVQEPITMNREPKVHREPKRRNLSPLMSDEAKATASIHELSYDFACRITRLFQYLTEDAEYKEYVQSKQIYRSGTSIGANRRTKQEQSQACLGYALQEGGRRSQRPGEQTGFTTPVGTVNRNFSIKV